MEQREEGRLGGFPAKRRIAYLTIATPAQAGERGWVRVDSCKLAHSGDSPDDRRIVMGWSR